MAESIAELILADVVAACGRVTESLGYDADATVSEADAPRPTVLAAVRDVAVLAGELEYLTDAGEVPLGHDGFRLHVDLVLTVRVPDESETTTQRALLKLESDVLKELMRDYTRGGYATTQTFGQSKGGQLSADNPRPARQMELIVTFYTLMDNPHQQ